MQNKKMFVTIILVGILLTVISIVWLGTAQPVSAQCGSQASTCKDCHEVQGQKSVNADGTGWHQSHAFGDFCYICHGGNQQAADKDASHTGMVSPFADTKASCQQCHPKDLDERAKVYMDKLGITAGDAAAAAPVQQVVVTICEPTNEPPADANIVLAKPAQVTDYIARYNENVLGNKAVDWGMIGLTALIVVVVFAALIFFVLKMGWVVVTFEKPVKAEVKETPKA